MNGHAAQQAYEMEATKSFGIITQVSPETFIEIVKKQENPLILQSSSKILFFKKHYRYVISYKGLTFFTKCYNPIEWQENVEIVRVRKIVIPGEGFTIY